MRSRFHLCSSWLAVAICIYLSRPMHWVSYGAPAVRQRGRCGAPPCIVSLADPVRAPPLCMHLSHTVVLIGCQDLCVRMSNGWLRHEACSVAAYGDQMTWQALILMSGLLFRARCVPPPPSCQDSPWLRDTRLTDPCTRADGPGMRPVLSPTSPTLLSLLLALQEGSSRPRSLLQA